MGLEWCAGSAQSTNGSFMTKFISSTHWHQGNRDEEHFAGNAAPLNDLGQLWGKNLTGRFELCPMAEQVEIDWNW